MPAPHGSEPRDEKFLLRMTKPENAFVRALAKHERRSLNDVLTGLIRERMARYGKPPTTPADPPQPAAKPTPAKSPRGGRASIAERAKAFTPPEDEPIPGQTSITDEDQ